MLILKIVTTSILFLSITYLFRVIYELLIPNLWIRMWVLAQNISICTKWSNGGWFVITSAIYLILVFKSIIV